MEKCLKGPSLSDPGIFNDPYLLGFADTIFSRHMKAVKTEQKIAGMAGGSILNFADYHEFFGLHFCDGQWVFREWAPNAVDMFIVCEKTGWQKCDEFRLKKKGEIFEKYFEEDVFSHRDLYRLQLVWNKGEGDRIPTAATRVVQDPETLIFNAQVWHPEKPYEWKKKNRIRTGLPLLIYEAHVGMALEEPRIGTFREFEREVLPKIAESGYNAIQFMAIQEHPYYGSFGYHVANFFAPSSRFGTPDDLKRLVDAAHEKGLAVLMDIVHSHAVNNTVEGLSEFDGTAWQFFHDGPRGYHHQWDSRCFDYGKPEVIKFLLSNLKYWMEEFHVDGFRFDGITSMLFFDHGLGRSFTCYEDYYGDDVDEDALSYLYLANRLVHELNPDFITIAEDVSGYPGLAGSLEQGGTGFDFRFAMGIADFWIKVLKEYRDEDWPLGELWHELTAKRAEEKTVSYAESHDQALVGDKTIMMRLMEERIYDSMGKDNETIETFRGVALHKMIRFITFATADSGYLNFMGNEFGHPEWIDFPSIKNGFSCHYARRQWSLKENRELFFSALSEFDRQMLLFAGKYKLFSYPGPDLICVHELNNIIAFKRGSLFFVFNFHPQISFTDYRICALPGKYIMVFNSDDSLFGGKGRLSQGQVHFTLSEGVKKESEEYLSLYLPTRTVIVLHKALE